MSAYALAQASPSGAGQPLAARIRDAVLGVARRRIDAYLDAREARRAYRFVRAMSDRQLNDIGVSRAAVNAHAFLPAARPGQGRD